MSVSMRIFKAILSVVMLAALSAPSFAQDFVFGIEGCCDSLVNQWPGGENPTFAIDGFGQKYLNFGEQNTGFAVTPSVGSSVATSIKLWTANDAVQRDPASYQVWGSNATLDAGATSFPISAFTAISVGDLALPESRNAGGADTALDDANSQTITFDNSAAYTSYLVVFPDVKDAEGTNSMQIADVQLYDAAGAGIFAAGDPIVGGQVVPEPSSSLLGAMSLLSIMLFVRKRRNS